MERGRPPGGGRDFADVVWQIGEKRCCDEVLVRYDCGHAMRADVWVPALPKTHEYTNQEAERRRFMQHCFFVLTKDPGAPKVQITVPEGRCRHCGRGQRQCLLCGPLQMDLAEVGMDKAKTAQLMHQRVPTAMRRLELVLSSHVFLAAMGQVCRLPDDITPPPLMQSNGALGNGVLKPTEGPLPQHEGARQCCRKDIEDELRAKVVKYVGGATCLLLVLVVECLYLLIMWTGAGEGSRLTRTIASELGNVSALSTAIDGSGANTSWPLSALSFALRSTFGSPVNATKENSSTSFWWTLIVQPAWFLLSVVLAPIMWVLELLVALPRFLFFNVLYTLVHGLVWSPCCWLCGICVDIINNPSAFLFRCFSRPPAIVSLIPMANAMIGAMLLSLLVAILSAPQPLSLSLQSVWGELPSLGLARGNQKQRSMPRLWTPARKDGIGGARGMHQAARGQKDKGAGRYDRDRTDGPDRGDKHGRERSGSSSQMAATCFVCLDRPSHYILEPCGHRVVCGDCAMQLVEIASRSRTMGDGVAGQHRPSEKSGGTCPSCSMPVKQAMRVFS